MITTTTATASEIDQLMTAAGQAGDEIQVDLCQACESYADALNDYARLTAADMGGDMVQAVRAMSDERGEVARAIGCSDVVVTAWIKCWDAIWDAAGRA